MQNLETWIGVVGVAMAAMAATGSGAELADVALPRPRMEGGKPLLQALKDRCSTREFSPQALPPQLLSDLLWAANGVNRPDSGKRTAPTARNWQEIDVYVFLETGAYLYDAKANRLQAVAAGDLRKLTGMQDFVATAPLNLVYVADPSRMEGAKPDDQATYAAIDAGFISQNVYLFCASEGLATVVRGTVNRADLAKAINLPEGRKIILAQTVGYPAQAAR